jgi:hypothetical protein
MIERLMQEIDKLQIREEIVATPPKVVQLMEMGLEFTEEECRAALA